MNDPKNPGKRFGIADVVRSGECEESTDSPIDEEALTSLSQNYQTMAPDALVPILENVVRCAENPITLDRMMSIANLYEISTFFLLERDPEPFHFMFLQILSSLLQIPGSIDRMDTETMAQILQKHASFCAREVKSIDPLFPLCLLRLMGELVRPPFTAQFFKDFVPFLFLCVDSADKDIVREAFVVMRGLVKVLWKRDDDKPWRWFTTSEWIDKCVSHLGALNPKTFGLVCSFLGKLSINNAYMVPLVPMRYAAVHTELFDRIQDDDTMTIYLRYLTNVEMTRDLIGKFVSEIASRILNLIQNGSFAVSQAACELLSHVIESFPEVMEDRIIEWGTLDFIVKYFEAEDLGLIEDILATTCTMVNRYLESHHWTPMVQVIGNSELLIDTLRSIQSGDMLQELFDSSDRFQEALHMTLEAFENALELVGCEPTKSTEI